MTGFDGLVQSRFNGDYEAARQAVADLGRASVYCNTRPGFAAYKLYRHKVYRSYVVYEGDVPVDTNLSNRVK